MMPQAVAVAIATKDCDKVTGVHSRIRMVQEHFQEIQPFELVNTPANHDETSIPHTLCCFPAGTGIKPSHSRYI